MGHPRKLKKKWSKPRRLPRKEEIESQKELQRKYGLKRKKEQLRARAFLSQLRANARAALGSMKESKKQYEKAQRLGLISNNGGVEDILALKIEDVLNRRLQTLVYLKKLANSQLHARQLITHGKIQVGNEIKRRPSFLVPRKLEDRIKVVD